MKEGKAQENSSPVVSPSNQIEKIIYGKTNEELEARQEGLVISPKEAEWERRQRLTKSSRLCQQVCELQVIIEPNHEGTCSIQDVDIDTIYAFTNPLEEELEASSCGSDHSKIRSIYDNTYSTPNYDYFDMNVEILSEGPVTVEPQHVVQSEVEEGASGRSVGLDPLNADVNLNNRVITLPGREMLTQGSILELNLSVQGCDDNTVNSLELVEYLSLVHPELIDYTLQDQPLNIPIFANDYTLASYLNEVKQMNSSTNEQSENMIEENVKYLSLKNQKKKNKCSDGDNHTMVVSELKIVKIKDVPNDENLSATLKGEILDIFPDRFQEQSSVLIEPIEPVNIRIEETQHIIHVAQSLSPKELKEFANFFTKKKINFAWTYVDMSGLDLDLIMHYLSISPRVKPVKQKLQKMHPHVALLVKAELEKLLKVGFIRAIDYAEWISNIVPVSKPDKSIRVCTDFKDLNKSCPKDDFPLPNIDMIVDMTASYEMYSLMDGFYGYNQIKIALIDQDKTTFTCAWGDFYWNVMPFGLKNASATYQRAVTMIFHDMMHKNMEEYIDDTLLKSMKISTHLLELGPILDSTLR